MSQQLKIFLVSFFFLSSCIVGFLGRELQCSYHPTSAGYFGSLWPAGHRCELTSVDLSAAHNSESFSFSGTPTQKSQTTVVRFEPGVSSLDFIPKETITAFPNLNGLVFAGYNSPVLKGNLFTVDFIKIEYLYLPLNKIQTIESNAFGHLNKLKWIRLDQNQIQSLPFKIFKNNPEMIYIRFYANKIASINPNFFDGLNKLKYVDFREHNLCINKLIGCETCSVSQSTLNLELALCFSNCPSNLTCLWESFQKPSITSLDKSIVSIKEDLLGHLSTKTLEMQSSLALSNKKTLDSDFNVLSTNLAKQTQQNFQETKEVLTELENKLKENSEMFKEEIGKQTLSFAGVSTNIKNEFESAITSAAENLNATLKEATEKTESILNETKAVVAEVEPTISGAVDKLTVEMKETTEFNKKTFKEATEESKKLNKETVEINTKTHQDTIESLKEIVLEKTEDKLEKHLQKTDVKVDQAVRMLTAELEVEKLKAENKEMNYVKEKEAMDTRMQAMNAEIKSLNQDKEIMNGEIKGLKQEVAELQKQQLQQAKEFEDKLNESKKQNDDIMERLEELKKIA